MSDEARAIAKSLSGRERAAILLGNYAQQHADYAVLAAIAHEIARLTGATLGVLAQNANSVGAKLVGAFPAEGGLDTRAMVTDPRKAWLVAGFEPERDAAMAPEAIAALKAAEFVVALSAWRCWAPEYAHVILPIAPSAETAGTFVNMEGRVQSFHAVVKPRGDARPGWKVLRMLGTMLGLPGFEAETIEAVRESIAPDLRGLGAGGALQCAGAVRVHASPRPRRASSAWPNGRSTAPTRRCAARRACRRRRTRRAAARARMNAATAIAAGLALGDRVRVTQGGGEAVLEVAIDPALPDGCVRIARGIAETVSLGEGALTLREGRRGGRRMTEMLGTVQGAIEGWFGPAWGPYAWVFAKSLAGIVAVLVPLLLTVLYYQLVERWVIGWIQVRKGPNRVGWKGVLQPIADAIKLLMKERIVPAGASQGALLPRAHHLGRAGARRVGRGALRARLGDRERRRGPPRRARHDLDGRLRDHHRRLGVELEVRVPGRHALGGAGGRLRDRHGLRAGGRAHGRAEPEPHRRS